MPVVTLEVSDPQMEFIALSRISNFASPVFLCNEKPWKWHAVVLYTAEVTNRPAASGKGNKTGAEIVSSFPITKEEESCQNNEAGKEKTRLLLLRRVRSSIKHYSRRKSAKNCFFLLVILLFIVGLLCFLPRSNDFFLPQLDYVQYSKCIIACVCVCWGKDRSKTYKAT